MKAGCEGEKSLMLLICSTLDDIDFAFVLTRKTHRFGINNCKGIKVIPRAAFLL
jgi:hypothetical protein